MDDLHVKREAYEFQFKVGRSYRRVDGKIVKIISESMISGVHYRCVQGDDGAESFDPEHHTDVAHAARVSGWRYDRHGDVGRCTGSKPGGARDLVAGAIDIRVGDMLFVVGRAYRRDQVPSRGYVAVTKVGRKYFYTGEGASLTRFAMPDTTGVSREAADTNYPMRAYLTQQDYENEVEYASLLASVKDEFRGYCTSKTLSLPDLRAIAVILKVGE